MPWLVLFHADFLDEFAEFGQDVQDEIAAMTELLAEAGPALKRPFADTLKGSKFVNMRELRFDAADGVWRLAYAFDPERQAILLTAGDKSGVASRRFYKTLITKADARFTEHLDDLKKRKKR